MNNKIEKYLPLGTVVMLKGGKKRLMITGFCVSSIEAPDKTFDYCGCLFPEGVVSTDKNALFNHEQIELIYHYGLSDAEERDFKNKLNKLLEVDKILKSDTDSNSSQS